jgi:hypothetical protein
MIEKVSRLRVFCVFFICVLVPGILEAAFEGPPGEVLTLKEAGEDFVVFKNPAGEEILGDVLTWKRTEDGLVFTCQGGMVKVSAHGDRIIRVRAVPGEKLGPDESFAVIDTAPQGTCPCFRETESGFDIKTEIMLEFSLDSLGRFAA